MIDLRRINAWFVAETHSGHSQTACEVTMFGHVTGYSLVNQLERYAISSRAALLSCVLAVVLFAATTSAAPPPNYAIRLTATYHLQLTVTDVQVPEFLPGICRISGTVANVFRSPAGMVSDGDEIEVLSECDVAGPEGDTGALADADELSNARHIEMYLNPGAEAAYELAGEQYMVIKAPTPEPLCETDKAGITC